WGLMPDMAITTTLCRCMPADRIKELALTGRVIDGAEACRLGLVTAVHEDPSQAARITAAEIADKSPDAIRAIKRLFDLAWTLSDADALRLEAELQLTLLGGQNQVEAAMSNIERRAPRFVDPKS
ncbi:MAG: enoyl-CoA hydratase-related protein, partial [Gammaproteobacteria bacterium]|nr:enoyl-CoA hydratase-related protein [Gammaproteobacteria bacterium]